jgi:hypothetical protein
MLSAILQNWSHRSFCWVSSCSTRPYANLDIDLAVWGNGVSIEAATLCTAVLTRKLFSVYFRENTKFHEFFKFFILTKYRQVVVSR